MKRLERNLLVIILLLSALLSITVLTRGHLWWDDFASYILQAQSLLDGSPADFVRHNTFTIENSSIPPGPVAYPWGFPALLVPVLALAGVKVLALKLINTLFFLFFLVVFAMLARLRLPWGWSLALTALLAFNPALLAGHDLILSDIPFLFFSTYVILLIELQSAKNSLRGAAWTGAAIFLAFSLRTNGILLLVPLLVSQVLDWKALASGAKKWQPFLPYAVFAVLFLLQRLLLPDGQESYFTHFSMFTWGRFFGNAWYYVRLPIEFMKPIPLGALFLWLMLGLFLFEVFVSLRRNLPILSYMLVTLGLLITWPETQGLRFLYPLLPLFLLLAGQGLLHLLDRLSGQPQQLVRWSAFLLTAVLLLLSLGASARHSVRNMREGREINGPFDPVSQDMFEFIREQTPPDSVVVFFKPRAMRLFTGRDAFMTLHCADLSKGDYLVIHEKQGSNGQIGDLSVCPGIDYPVVYNNLRFTVYEVIQ